ncbi:MAG TPA: SRPBCC domain-containing protein [Gemmataceae bacterium]|nr:SRPBCC domain-containing protein [Gemmataceae bacterium]
MQAFEGERIFPVPPEQLWPKLRDASYLAKCIPGGTPHEGATCDSAVCTVHPGFSFMRGSLDVTITVMDGHQPTSVRYLQKSKGIGSESEVETALTLAPVPEGTKIQWRSEVKSLGGLLKMLPSGLIRGAAQKVIEDGWQGVAEKLKAGD